MCATGTMFAHLLFSVAAAFLSCQPWQPFLFPALRWEGLTESTGLGAPPEKFCGFGIAVSVPWVCVNMIW